MRLLSPPAQVGRARRRQHGAARALLLGVAGSVLLLASAVGCRGGQQGELLLGVRQSAHSRGLSPEDRRVVARTALTIMARLAEVREQVRSDQLATAAERLAGARDLTQLIAASAPTFSLRERVQIVRTHLAFQDAGDVVHELVPIERELDELGWLLPIQEAQEHLRRARDALARGNREAASRNLEAVADAVVYQEVDLPVKEVDADIVAAEEALQLRRLDEVDALLKRAESSLDVLTVWASGEEVPAPVRAAPAPAE